MTERPKVKFDPKMALGYTGLKRWAGRISEEWDPTLKGPKAIRLYREMLDSEPVLATPIHMITTVLQQAAVYAEPASEDPLAVEAADFLESCLQGMDCTWEEFLAEALTVLPFGWAYFEQVYQQRPQDNRLGWRKIEIRAQDTLQQWEFDDEGELLGMWQMGPPDFRRVFIPIEKAVHFVLRGDKRNPEGKSSFRACKRPYLFKRNLEEIEAVGIERDLAGLPVLEVPPEMLAEDASIEDKAYVDALFKLVQSIRRDEQEAALLPAEEYTTDGGDLVKTGFRFRLLASGGTRQVDASKPIERYEHRMLMTFLAEFLLLGSQGGGSFALAKDKTDFLVLSLTATLKGILATFNREAVARLMEINGFPAEAHPKLCHEDLESPALEELSSYVSSLIGSGAMTPDDAMERKLREYASLPQMGEGDEPVFAPRPEGEGEAGPEPRQDEGDHSDLQSTALNGAQVTAAKEIVLDVVAGRLPRETAVSMLQEFFQLSVESAERVLGAVGRGFRPAQPVEPGNGGES